jgi:hypothetical protein
MARVLVLGATGGIGRRVARLLRVRDPSIDLLGTSRSGWGDSSIPLARANVLDVGSLRPLLREARVVVNAVGPYDWDPQPLLGACGETDCAYVDLAEAPAFLAAVAEAADGLAVSVVSGASTVPGLVEVLAQRFAELAAVARVDAWLSLGSDNPVSPGLLAGLLAPLGRPRPDGTRWFGTTRAFAIDERVLRFGDYPAPWADGIPLGDRSVPVAFHVGFDRAWLTRGLAAVGAVFGRVPERRVARLAAPLAPLARTLRRFGTPRGALAVVASDAAGAEVARVEVAARENGLDVPALPAVWAAAALARASAPRVGLVPLRALIGTEAAVQGLRERGFAVA